MPAKHCAGCRWAGGPCVIGRGNPQAPLALLGEAPGTVEIQRGVAFTGPSGQLLDDLLHRAVAAAGLCGKLSFSDFWITNCVCCDTRGQTPTLADCKLCWPRLSKELTGKYVIALGQVAQRNLRHHRWPLNRALFVWHPAYILRNPLAAGGWVMRVRDFLSAVHQELQGATK